MKTIGRISVLSITASYILSPFIDLELSLLIFINGLVVYICAVPIMDRSFRLPAISFFLCGNALLLYFEQPLSEWIAGTVSMLNIIAILAIMQLFSIPIQAGRYGEALEFLIKQQFEKESTLFLFLTAATNIFSSFLLFGTVPVMISLFGELLKHNVSDYKRFAATAISRGYSLVVLWTPGGVNILLIMQATGAKWIDIFWPGIILCLFGIILSYHIERRRLTVYLGTMKLGKDLNLQDFTVRDAWLKLIDVIFVVVCFIVLMVAFENVSFINSTLRVLFSGLIIVIIWLFKVVSLEGLVDGLLDYWSNKLMKTIDMAALFVAIGIFARSLAQSGALGLIQPFLASMAQSLGVVFVGCLPLIITFTAILGIHPFISIVLIGQVVISSKVPIDSLAVALALSLGGAVSYIVSPFAGIVLTLARFLNTKPQEIAFGWNWSFCAIYLLCGMIFIILLEIF